MSKPVLVRWVDSCGEGGWHQRGDAKREAHEVNLEARTVGFVVDETDDWLLLAMGSMHKGNVVHDTMQIPKTAIRSVQQLSKAKSKS